MSNAWYPWYPGDYARDTSHLSMVEDCCYRRLLDYYYSTGKPLPANAVQVHDVCIPFASRLHRICRAVASEEKTAVDFVIAEFFVLQDDGYHHKRVDAELEKTREVSEKRALAARAMHEKRLQKEQEIADALALHLLTHPQPQPQPHLQPQSQPPTQLQKAKSKQQDSQKKSKNDFSLAANKKTWDSYCQEFFFRYGTEPIRNAKQNSLIKKFTERIGQENAPEVIAFYLQHSMALYVRAGHCLDLALRDAEKLYAEWQTGRQVTEQSARQKDKTSTMAGIVQEIIMEREHEKRE